MTLWTWKSHENKVKDIPLTYGLGLYGHAGHEFSVICILPGADLTGKSPFFTMLLQVKEYNKRLVNAVRESSEARQKASRLISWALLGLLWLCLHFSHVINFGHCVKQKDCTALKRTQKSEVCIGKLHAYDATKALRSRHKCFTDMG